MIKPGDKFTYLDLQSSMAEIVTYDVRKYLKTGGKIGIMRGACGIMVHKYNPNEYAKICTDAYGDIKSSAKSLDQQLADNGFKTTFRFSHEYNTVGLSPSQIVHDAYCLDWFLQICSLHDPKPKYAEKYIHAIDTAFRLTYYYAQYLWGANQRATADIARALQMPDVEQWTQIIAALLGIGFGFHPFDVYEFAVNHISPRLSQKEFDTRYRAQLSFQNEIRTNYGIDTGCLVLSPQNQEKLRKIVTGTDTPYPIQVIRNLIFGRARQTQL